MSAGSYQGDDHREGHCALPPVESGPPLAGVQKRICLAGFSEPEMGALKPALAKLGAGWDCVFCLDGETALATLAAGRFAAVVADLRMSGMSGAELLQETAVSYPHTLRFALGAVADYELIVNSIGAPYQFISRPCQPQELISLIERSLSLDGWLSNDTLRAFVPKLGRLPDLPSTYFEVVRKAESPDASAESIGEVIARDPTLTARLLQLVNSAASGVAQKITSPVEAVLHYGVDTVKSLAMCLHVFSLSAPVERASIPLKEFWRHSFAVAQLASKIVQLETGDDRLAADAFTAGLLHRVGQIILATNLSQEYGRVLASVREKGRSLPESELAEFGLTSNQVGAYLLGLWGMPLPLVEAAALYSMPSCTTSQEFSLLTAVHVADVLAQEAHSLSHSLPLSTLDGAYLAALNLPQKPGAWRKRLVALTADASCTNPDQHQPVIRPSIHSQTRSPARARELVGLAMTVVLAAVAFTQWSAGYSPGPGKKLESRLVRQPLKRNSALDSIEVQSIFYRVDHPVAVINGKTVSPGQEINGATVISIQPSNVTLSFEGERRTFSAQ